MTTKQNLFDYITLARGFGIAGVIIAHAVIPNIREPGSSPARFWYLAYAITLPLFMSIAGYLFERGLPKYLKQGYIVFMRGKFMGLMVPYIVFLSIAYIGIAVGSHRPFIATMLERFHFYPRGVWEAVIEMLTLENLISKHLWYCYTLFLVFAVSYHLRAFLKTIPGLVFVFFLYLVSTAYPLELPSLAERVFHYLIFFHLGRWMGVAEKLFRPCWLPLYFCLAAGVYMLIDAGSVQFFGFFGGTFVCLLGIFGALFFITLSRVLASVRAAWVMNTLGEYSYDIYLIHQPVLTAGTAGMLWVFFKTLAPWTIVAIASMTGALSSYLIGRYIIRPIPVLRHYLLGMKSYSRYVSPKSNDAGNETPS